MTYLIISVYDGGWDFNVCENGEIIVSSEKLKFYKNIYDNSFIENEEYDEPPYMKEFAKLDFDFIVLCDDGHIEILKGGK